MAHLYFMPATHPQTLVVLLCVITLLPRNSGDQRFGCTSERRELQLELIQGRRSSTWSQGLVEEVRGALHRPCKCSTGHLHHSTTTSPSCSNYSLLQLFTPRREGKFQWSFFFFNHIHTTNQDCILPPKSAKA